jgi:chromosome segregation ATPase
MSQVYDPDLTVEWGTHWQELQQATEFAQWYTSIDNWHQASAEQLRVGVGGVQRMHQRIQHLTVMLAQAEQAVQSTRRQRQSDHSNKTVELQELQELQEQKMEAMQAEKTTLAGSLAALQKQLDKALEDRKKAEEEMEEASEQMLNDLESVTKELREQQQTFERQEVQLRDQLKAAMEQQQTCIREKYLAEQTVVQLQADLDKAMDKAGRHRLVARRFVRSLMQASGESNLLSSGKGLALARAARGQAETGRAGEGERRHEERSGVDLGGPLLLWRQEYGGGFCPAPGKQAQARVGGRLRGSVVRDLQEDQPHGRA